MFENPFYQIHKFERKQKSKVGVAFLYLLVAFVISLIKNVMNRDIYVYIMFKHYNPLATGT